MNARLGLAGLLMLACLAIGAPWLSPTSPDALVAPLAAPSLAHPLGTDDVGHDLLTELLFGARQTLIVGAAVSSVTVVASAALGVAAGYFGGWADALAMRAADVFLAMPRLPLALLIITLVGAGVLPIIIVLVLLSWAWGARLVRGQVLSLRARTHVRAAELFGAAPFYMARRHLLPELAPVLLAELVAIARFAIFMEAGLAFLGLSDPTIKSWGRTLNFALNHPGIYFTTSWLWWVLPPSVALCVLITSLTLLGTALESRANPRLMRSA